MNKCDFATIALLASILTIMFFYLIDFIFVREPKKYIGSKQWKEDFTKKVHKLEDKKLMDEWDSFLKNDCGSGYWNEKI